VGCSRSMLVVSSLVAFHKEGVSRHSLKTVKPVFVDFILLEMLHGWCLECHRHCHTAQGGLHEPLIEQ
jgi:hypothetical protein